MRTPALPFHTLKKGSASSRFSITRFTHPRIRYFLNGFRQYLRAYHSPDSTFAYYWVKVQNGDVFLALSGSRSIQDVFAHYLKHNQGCAYFSSASITVYDGRFSEFAAAFAELADASHASGRSR